MTSCNNPPVAAAELRAAAEAMLREQAVQSPEYVAALSPAEIRTILHELRVHQIQLEMQNEELRRAQAELDAVRARYFDLYDLAPVGYCTVAESGLILEANLTAASLLGVARSALVRRPLSQFILNVEKDRDIYYLCRKQLLETGQPQECELRMAKADDDALWLRLQATIAQESDGTRVARIAMSDITKRKRAETQLLERLAQLRFWEKATLGREVRMLEVKQEVNQLLAQAGQPPRYVSVLEELPGSEP